MHRLLFFALLLPTLAAPADATPSQDAALHTIATATAYSWGSVGTQAQPSDAERAARAIWKSAAPRNIGAAFDTATTEGKLYLLCLLVRMDRPAFEARARELQARADLMATTFSGNVMRKEPAALIVRQIARSNCEPLDWAEPAK